MAPAKRPNARAKGEGSVYQIKSGDWVASIGLPSPDGRRRQATRQRRTEAGAKEQLKLLRRELISAGDISTSGETVGTWLEYWFREFVEGKRRPKTARNYRSTLTNHIIPSIGKKRLDQLTPAHIRKMHADILAKGLKSTTALYAHNVLTASLTDAMREGRITKSPATLTRAPGKTSTALTVLTAAHGVQVLRTVLTAPEGDEPDRLGSRWAAALLTGARQGELIGLELDRVSNNLDLSWQLQRLSWLHGCSKPCGRKRGTDCPARRLDAPANWEHRHVTGGLWLSRPKSNAGWRIIPLVEPLRSIIEQRVLVAATEPNPHGFVWTADPKKDRHGRVQPLDGSPIDPSRDNAAWHVVLERAGVPSARLHDARHTTASLLQKARVPMSARMRILGHGSAAMVEHYTDVDEEQLGAGLTAMSALMPWAPDPPSTPALDTLPPPE